MSKRIRKLRENTGVPIQSAGQSLFLPAGLIIIVCFIVAAVYWPVLSCKTLSFDDEYYLVNNRLVQTPSWNSVKRFFSEVLAPSTVKGYYQPLTMISLMADYALGGRANNLTPFHITSLILHLFNTSLIIIFLYMLFGRIWPAAIAGLIFGVHPVTIEPIAWIAERKTLLAAFFVLLSLIFYVRYAQRKKLKLLIACFIAYLLALMSKPSALPLPFLLLLLDYWPLQRLSKKAILEKILLFAICGIFTVLAMISQSTFGIRGPGTYNFITTVLLICHNNIAYLYNILWPINLALFYAFPMWIPAPLVTAGTIGLAGLLLISLRWTKALLTGWLFFFIAIFPVLGVTWVHDMIIADRHIYLPFTGILIFICELLSRIWDKAQGGLVRSKVLRFLTVIILCAIIILETALTRKYSAYWKDTETHRRRMAESAPYEPIVHNSLGIELFKQGKYDEAISYYNKALTLRPGVETAIHYNMANALMRQGRFDEAAKHYAESVRLDPNQADAYDGLGWALACLGKYDEAVENCRKALKLAGDLITAHGHLGLALAGEGKTDEAVRELQIFLSKSPNDFEMHCNLGILLEKQGKTDEAAEQYRQALKLNPDYTKAGERLKAVLEKRGK